MISERAATLDMVMVGDRYLLSGFRLIGVETIEAADVEAAARKVEELAYEGKVKIVLISEKVAVRLKRLREDMLKTRRFYPIFVIIPDLESPLNERIKELHQLVSQAIGVKLKIGD